MAVALACLAPLLNWWLLPLLGAWWLTLVAIGAWLQESGRPQSQALASLFVGQYTAGAAVAMTGGARSPLLTLIVVPTAAAATRLKPRLVWLGVATAVLILIVASFGADPGGSLGHPAGLIGAMAVLVGVCAAVQALGTTALRHRESAVLDPLTGLLNRHGLEHRFEELVHQAQASGAPISLLVCDLDRFKEVNDTHGHAVGDGVLREIAARLRRQLRSFELMYRIGGDEFLVVLPGARLEDAKALAERLCEATRLCRPHGLELTLSVGVATRWGSEARLAPLFDEADRSLYRAKAEGRDRVGAPGPEAPRGAEPLAATG
jgi:diguanylate cyclase (GGDEF)-like protein